MHILIYLGMVAAINYKNVCRLLQLPKANSAGKYVGHISLLFDKIYSTSETVKRKYMGSLSYAWHGFLFDYGQGNTTNRL